MCLWQRGFGVREEAVKRFAFFSFLVTGLWSWTLERSYHLTASYNTNPKAKKRKKTKLQLTNNRLLLPDFYQYISECVIVCSVVLANFCRASKQHLSEFTLWEKPSQDRQEPQDYRRRVAARKHKTCRRKQGNVKKARKKGSSVLFRQLRTVYVQLGSQYSI